jgi:hypothetical protein
VPEDAADGDVGSPWGVSDDDVRAAEAVWGRLSEVARHIFRDLMETAPEKISAQELASRNELSGHYSLAGVLTWPARHAAAEGKALPVNWEPGAFGEGGQYWMDEVTAAAFKAAAGLRGA